MLSSYIESHIKEGEDLYSYLFNNYHNMIDGNVIKHFNIGYVSSCVMGYNHDIKDTYKNELEQELLPWIKIEYEEDRLLQKSNWRPFNDRFNAHYMYLGYNKLFRYKQYYFQLTINTALCESCEDCKYCNNESTRTHFELALYGWVDEKFKKLQPDDKYIVLSDDMMPLKDWNNNFY